MRSNSKPQETEKINSGKRIIRTNIIPVYKPVDESKIEYKEVLDLEVDGTHTEPIYPEQIIDYWTYDEEIEYKSCYALLNLNDYLKLNKTISELLGFNIEESTERYSSMNPPACKYNLQINGESETYEVRLVMPINSELQIKYPELFKDLEMFDDYVPVDAPIQELLVDIADQQTLYWTLLQFSVGGNKEDLRLIISPETQVLITPELMSRIEKLGLNIELQ